MTQLINGQWQAGLGEQMQSLNPANQEIIWQGKSATIEQVEQAVMAARTAQFDWFMLGLMRV